MTDNDDKSWLSSKDAMKKGKIQACDLMHYRVSGKVDYKKKGNAFFYNENDVIQLKKNKK